MNALQTRADGRSDSRLALGHGEQRRRCRIRSDPIPARPRESKNPQGWTAMANRPLITAGPFCPGRVVLFAA